MDISSEQLRLSILLKRAWYTLKISAGKMLYATRKWISWIMHEDELASTFSKIELPFIAASHKTPLYRKLKKYGYVDAAEQS